MISEQFWCPLVLYFRDGGGRFSEQFSPLIICFFSSSIICFATVVDSGQKSNTVFLVNLILGPLHLRLRSFVVRLASSPASARRS